MSVATVPPSAMATPALTTTFIPKASTCTENHLTILPDKSNEIWMNAPIPVSGTTFSDCYPTQFMSSYLLAASSTIQPAFNPLVCPENYSTVGAFASNYIACCPSGYTWAQPTTTQFPDRPAYGGTCYTPLPSGVPFTATSYGHEGVATITTFQATVTNAKAYANPLDGYAYGGAQVTSAPTTGIIAAPGVRPTPGILPGPNGTIVCSAHTVMVAASPSFVPSSVNANIGDEVIFKFLAGNHTITQSTYDKPCEKLLGGFDSGYMGGHGDIADVFTLKVNGIGPSWFFSQQSGECGNGMVFALNPIYTQPFTTFQQNAISQGSSSPTSSSKPGLSQAVKIGVITSSVAGSFLLLSIIFVFCWQYKRRSAAQKERGVTNDYTYDRKNNSNSSCSDNLGTTNSESHIGTWNDALGLKSTNEPHRPAVPPKDQRELHSSSKHMEIPAEKSPPAELYGSEAFIFESEEKEMGSGNKTRSASKPPCSFNDYEVQGSPWDDELDPIPETPPLRTWPGNKQRREPIDPRALVSPTSDHGSPHGFGSSR
ncbi:uncharacterized protein BP5553_01345 [Venustampulla echinocandica]|uniref:Cupredoxin n=1 Tax=Venustampulla echinocandica TaxID=2656787 RepID=A0A370U0R1_9HELO|nr:uncharacterized protein BP5553_01345 [Venustampulla echinocandica]RDL41366.1 hypothetical protein BP5553_01345 [Venustampulla echinocandica]